MEKKQSDLWLNIYTFVLLPLCSILNCFNLYKGIKHFDAYDNKVISFFIVLFSLISIIYYAITFYFAKDRRRIGYNLILVSIGYSIAVASFNQTVSTYLGQGMKFYVMLIIYGILFTIFWGYPNYLYVINRKKMFETKKVDEETKKKIKEELSKILKNKKEINNNKEKSHENDKKVVKK